MLLEFKRLRGVACYKLAAETQPADGSEYMLVLEFDSKEGFDAYQSSPERVAAVAESETHDWRGLHSVKQRVQYELVKSWRR